MRTLLASIAALGLLASPIIASAEAAAQPAPSAHATKSTKTHKAKPGEVKQPSKSTKTKASGRSVRRPTTSKVPGKATPRTSAPATK